MKTCMDYIWTSDFIVLNQSFDYTYFACKISKEGLYGYFAGDETAPVIEKTAQLTIDNMKNEGIFSYHDIFFHRNIPVIILHNGDYQDYIGSTSLVADLYIQDKLVDSFEGDDVQSVLNSIVIKNIRYICRPLTYEVLKMEKDFLNHLEYKIFVYFDFLSGLFKKEELIKESVSSDFLPLFKGGYLSELIVKHLDNNHQNYIIISLEYKYNSLGNVSKEFQEYMMCTAYDRKKIFVNINDAQSLNKNLYILRENF